MKRWMIPLAAVLLLIGTTAYAQERPGPGTLEVTVIPGGGTYFASKDNEPGFVNYDLGGALTYQLNRFIGLEGEAGGSLGVMQDLQLGGVSTRNKTPNMFGYTGNVIVSPASSSRVNPYLAGGIGGLTVFQRIGLGINDTRTLLTGNVGGGVRWYANNRWGLRGDYRFVAIRGRSGDAPFFGQQTRYGNRIYGGVILNVMR